MLTPLKDEFHPLLEAFTLMGYPSISREAGRLPVCEIADLHLWLAVGGHGKTQFGVQTQHLLDLIPQVSLVICAGAAGGIDPTVQIGDVIIATHTIEHDFTNRFVKRPLPSFNGSPEHLEKLKALQPYSEDFHVHFGAIASGDEDIIDTARADEVRLSTGALAVAWEGAGGARAARFMGIPYVEIRGLTDVADHDAPAVFDENVKIIMPRIAVIVAKLLLSDPAAF